MEKENENEIEMANPDENSKYLHSRPIMPQGTERPNNLCNEIQEKKHRELKNILSYLAVYDFSQYVSESDQNQRSLNNSQTNFGERCVSNISGESNLLNQNQPSAPDLDISKKHCSIQNRNDVHNVGECNIRATNISQNSMYVPNDEQPSCSNDSNNNLYPIIPPNQSVNKQFSCQTCNNTYADESSLQRHLLTHYEEEKNECNICEKRFSTKVYLKTHMSIHFGRSRFSCNFCKRQCASKSNLEAHLLIHTGEKPFSCSDCKERFTFKQSLKKHIMRQTREKTYKCHICEEEFRTKCGLYKHMQDKHRIS